MKKPALLYVFTLLSFSGVFAQNGDIGDLIKGSVKDATYLLEGYVGPAMRGFGSGLNQGWYNTAKAHKTFGVDFTLNTSLMYVPTDEEYYKVDNNQLTEVKLAEYDNRPITTTESALVPTIYGPDKSPTYQTVESGNAFDGPPGLDLKNTIKIANALPVPMYQLGLGLPKNTDLKLRWSPTVKLGDFKFNLFGIGVMHDVGQYIPAVKALPVDISLFVGYTQLKAENSISGTVAGKDQKAALQFDATTIQALVSKKISVLTVYGGLGYNMVKSNLGMKGTYDLDEDPNTPETKDPVDLNFSSSGFRATGGLRLKLAVFTFHGDYTLAKYNALTVGFGINIR